MKKNQGNMKEYNFDIVVYLTYDEIEKSVSVPLSDDEVAEIKRLVEEADELKYGLLHVLREAKSNLFDKFWDIIFPVIFVENLYDARENGEMEIDENDEFDDWREADFEELYEMYGDAVELDYNCCLCKIPKSFLPPPMTLKKGMSKAEIQRYVKRSDFRDSLVDNISYECGNRYFIDDIEEAVDHYLISMVEDCIKTNLEETISNQSFSPFTGVSTKELTEKLLAELEAKYEAEAAEYEEDDEDDV